MLDDFLVEIEAAIPRELPLYFHVPFCAAKCSYCAFSVVIGREREQQEYFAALRSELERYLRMGDFSVPSVYFGGGTPSQVEPRHLVELLARTPLCAQGEVTVEVNPESVSTSLLAEYGNGGVTRISLGVQSLSDEVLSRFGRSHDKAVANRAIDMVGDYFSDFSVDMIYGDPHESPEQWIEGLRGVIEHRVRPTHVSCYGLTVERHTALALRTPDHPVEDDLAEKYTMADEYLSSVGYENYEVSNWALPGHECRHNMNYWSWGEYLGIGCSAHSHLSRLRWWNLFSQPRYMKAFRSDSSYIEGYEVLNEVEVAREKALLAMRSREGVPKAAIKEPDPRHLEYMIDLGDRWSLTPKGRLLTDALAGDLVP